MPDSYDVVSSREFAAPIAEVWRAWEDPKYVMQWWGPTGFTSPSAEMDFRVGGTSLVCMRAPAEFGGFDMYNTWTYRRIEPASSIEFDLDFTDAAGVSVEPPPGVPAPVRHVVTFAAGPEGRTSMTITEFGYPDEQVRDQSKAGLEQCLDKMTALLES
ncbi:SRPBCC domain-containing protein [Nocardia sp. NPDC051832]|uniref:SRPBCC family protein n=1 Tax=Nocardia sp. NPDC051832 TaxID=3155673 RepID=UPI0034279605